MSGYSDIAGIYKLEENEIFVETVFYSLKSILSSLVLVRGPKTWPAQL